MQFEKRRITQQISQFPIYFYIAYISRFNDHKMYAKIGKGLINFFSVMKMNFQFVPVRNGR